MVGKYVESVQFSVSFIIFSNSSRRVLSSSQNAFMSSPPAFASSYLESESLRNCLYLFHFSGSVFFHFAYSRCLLFTFFCLLRSYAKRGLAVFSAVREVLTQRTEGEDEALPVPLNASHINTPIQTINDNMQKVSIISLSSVFCFVRYKFSDYILHLQEKRMKKRRAIFTNCTPEQCKKMYEFKNVIIYAVYGG
nr:MAG TPA: hypothetical protein [Caudoviricetes sp.]